jgi:hypothetical protein
MTEPRQRRQLLGTVLTVVLILVAVLAHSANGDRYDATGESSVPGERAAVMQRASDLAARAMSYDSTASDKDLAKVEQDMTTDMRVEYERTLPSAATRKKQVGTGVKVIANVSRVGIVSLTKDEASVLVFVNQQASAKTTKKVLESPTWRILRLVRQDSQWLLGGMEAP